MKESEQKDQALLVTSQRLDEEQMYVQLKREIHLLWHTCDSLKNKGLGGEAVKDAVDVMERLLQSMQISDDRTLKKDQHHE